MNAVEGLLVSQEDLIARAVYLALKADPLVHEINAGNVYRRDFYEPSTVGTFPRTVVAAFQKSETGRISHKIKGSVDVGVIFEFWDSEPGSVLDEDAPSLASIISHYQAVIDQAGQLELTPDDARRLAGVTISAPVRLVRTRASYDVLSYNPIKVQSEEGSIAYYVGFIASYQISQHFPGRSMTVST